MSRHEYKPEWQIKSADEKKKREWGKKKGGLESGCQANARLNCLNESSKGCYSPCSHPVP